VGGGEGYEWWQGSEVERFVDGLFLEVLGSNERGHLAVFKEFKFEKSFNATFVSFIPKKAGVVDIDFCPIS
jgi:hypothetical protein